MYGNICFGLELILKTKKMIFYPQHLRGIQRSRWDLCTFGSQKYQKRGELRILPFRLKQCRTAALPFALLLFLHNPAPSLVLPPAALRLGSPLTALAGAGKLNILSYKLCGVCFCVLFYLCTAALKKETLSFLSRLKLRESKGN